MPSLRVFISVFLALRVASAVVRRENKGAAAESVAETDRTQKCPSEKNPKLLFNHIGKTGGTAVSHALYKIVPAEKLNFQEDIVDARLVADDKTDNFVIGLVRRPCDFMVSWFYEVRKDYPKMTLDEFVEGQLTMKGMTYEPHDVLSLNMSNIAKANEGPYLAPHLMSQAIAQRYGSGDNVHCMIREHNLEAEFLDCMQKYQACGGKFQIEEGSSLATAVRTALNEAVDIAHNAGRSVNDHPECKQLFSKDLETKVLATEQKVIDQFKLNSCCSP